MRSLLRERGRDKTQWEVGSSAEPPDLVDRLLERGLIRDKEPYAVALVLTRSRRRRRRRSSRAASRRSRSTPPRTRCSGRRSRCRRTRSRRLRALLPQDAGSETVNVMHAAWLDGELVAAGTSAPTEHGLLLYGGATRAARARPRRVPRSTSRALAGSGRERDAGADHAGRLDVAADPRAPRLRARRRDPHAARRVRRARRVNEFDFEGVFNEDYLYFYERHPRRRAHGGGRREDRRAARARARRRRSSTVRAGTGASRTRSPNAASASPASTRASSSSSAHAPTRAAAWRRGRVRPGRHAPAAVARGASTRSSTGSRASATSRTIRTRPCCGSFTTRCKPGGRADPRDAEHHAHPAQPAAAALSSSVTAT